MSHDKLGVPDPDAPNVPREFIRGQDFRFIMDMPCEIESGAFIDWVPTCILRRLDNNGPSGFIANIDVEWDDPVTCTQLNFLADSNTTDTATWPLGPAVFDVLFTHPDGSKRRSLPVKFIIVDGVTTSG